MLGDNVGQAVVTKARTDGGPTSPSYEGTTVAAPASVNAAPQVMIAGQGVNPAFAGLVSPGLYQITVTIPAITGVAGARH